MNDKLGLFFLFHIFLMNLVFSSKYSIANEMIRPNSYDDFIYDNYDPRTQIHFFIPNSKVAWADYEALKRDFPKLNSFTQGQIDDWIIKNFAFVSELQVKLKDIRVNNFDYDVNEIREFVHPPDYGRASVANEKTINQQALLKDLNPWESSNVLVDLKGTGNSSKSAVDNQVREYYRILDSNSDSKIDDINRLRIHDHSDGMMSLGESIAEVSRQKATQAGFDILNYEKGTSYQTVESYFIISLPIQILKENNKIDYAAIYGRQAHIRGQNGLDVPPEICIDDFGGRQASSYDSLVDFGGVIITQPELQQTFGNPDDYRTTTLARADAQRSNAWKYGHDTANAFMDQILSNPEGARKAITDHFSSMLSPLKQKLEKLAVKVK